MMILYALEHEFFCIAKIERENIGFLWGKGHFSAPNSLKYSIARKWGCQIIKMIVNRVMNREAIKR